MKNLKAFMEEFAEKNQIEKVVVADFIEKAKECKTLQDVLNLPYELQSHSNYVPDEPLYSYVREWDYAERHETVTLKSLLESLTDSINDLVEADEVILEDLTKEDIKALLPLDEDDSEELSKLKEILIHLIDTRFGSFVFDW